MKFQGALIMHWVIINRLDNKPTLFVVIFSSFSTASMNYVRLFFSILFLMGNRGYIRFIELDSKLEGK